MGILMEGKTAGLGAQKSSGKLISKHPTMKVFSHKKIKTTMYLKASTPYISALKRIGKLLGSLRRHGAEYVSVLGMGKAVEKCLSVACHYEGERAYRVEVRTQSVSVFDEIADSDDSEIDIRDEDRETRLQPRNLSGVEVRIYAS
ncbi:LAMI_0E08350g1_1 [Lachancea mirantina]|uniref:LAMI_0E08350g1_1 n=1 Tax=Lachancea mirantina TaxID=1230905 RepID=A0A1G4JN43_9SACH|nr:LAMI_0E08350g1_1 [Lachancea mirantina]